MFTPLSAAAGRWARIRPLLRGVLIFAVSLTIGRLCEVAFSQTTLARAVAAQDRWMMSVERLSPFGLAKGYASDLSHARRGEILFRGVDTAALMALDSAAKAATEERLLCATALSFEDTLSIALRCAHLGVSDGFRLAVLGREAEREHAEARAKYTAKETGAGFVRNVPTFLVPVLALVRLASRLFASGLWPAAITVLQLIMGWFGLLLFRRLVSPARNADADPSLAGVLLLPIAVVAMSSALAWALHAFMVGALSALHWVTALAAAAAGASGVVGFCWYCVTKLSERGMETALIRKG